MTRTPKIGSHPEAMLHLLLTIINKTPAGGATLDELQEAYREIKDRRPSKRTIYRLIKRLNLYFDPLAYGETSGEDEVKDEDLADEEAEVLPRAIRAEKRNGKTCYLYCDDFSCSPLEQSEILLTVLSLYPQQRSVLKNYYEQVLQRVLKDILSGISAYARLLSEIESHVYISGAVPSDPEKNVRLIKDIFRAIRQKKCVCFQYVRSYDGNVAERKVEPYGLLCRLNNWYLTGKCLDRQSERVYLLLNIRRLQVIEDSCYHFPPEFSLQKTYRDRWGIWTGADVNKLEKVRLKITRGPAERFRNNRYHDSQKIRELPGGDLEVTFTLRGAHEMIPWLMSWGRVIEILEPGWLKEHLMQAHRDALSHLAGNVSGEKNSR